MKKIITTLLLSMCATLLYAQNRLIIKDDMGVIKEYTVDQKFLDRFASFVRSQDQESRPFLADIHNALKNGKNRTITYNPETNIISGMMISDWTSMTEKEYQKMHGNANFFDANFNTKKQRFYVALKKLRDFYLYY